MQIKGTVKNIIFRSDDTGFTVLELVDDQGDEITAVGRCALPAYPAHPGRGGKAGLCKDHDRSRSAVNLCKRRLPHESGTA